MAKGISLRLGRNAVDPEAYEGWSGALIACEADARDMQAVARSQGYDTELALTSDATRQVLADRIAKAAS